jgi:hypothetical protein
MSTSHSCRLVVHLLPIVVFLAVTRFVAVDAVDDQLHIQLMHDDNEDSTKAELRRSLMARLELENWKRQPRDDSKPPLKIPKTCPSDPSNGTDSNNTTKAKAPVPHGRTNRLVPHTLTLVIQQASCIKTPVFCLECNSSFNVTRKIDLTVYYVEGQWQVGELFRLVKRYASETACQLTALSGERTSSDIKSGRTLIQRLQEWKDRGKLLMYYQDLPETEITQIGSEAELKLLLSRSTAYVVNILACVLWQ